MGCFFSSTRHDPFEADTRRAVEASRNDEEERIRRQRRDKEEQIDIERAKKESLRVAEEEEAKRKLHESKEKGIRKQVDDDKIKHSKDHVNPPPPPPSICNGCKSEIKDGISMNAFNAEWHPECFCCLHCRKPIAMHEV